MGGCVEYMRHAALFDHLAGIHHRHMLGVLRHQAQIVGNQNHRHLTLLLQAVEQIHDLRLHGYVKRGGRLVGNQQFRLAGQRHRNHHALAHAARQLVRISFQTAFGIGNFHQLEQLDCPRLGRRAFQSQMRLEHFGNLHFDGEARVEAGHRVLENH